MTAQNRTVVLAQGGHLNVSVSGTQGAPWVVLSNSVLTDLGIWDGQVGPLSERYRVLRYDQRGHGQSSVGDAPMGFDDYATDLRSILDEFEINNFTFVGLSMGVPTGLAAFSAVPERFTGFVAVDGLSVSATSRMAFWTERRSFARSNGMMEIARDFAFRWLPGAPESDTKCADLTAMLSRTPVGGFEAATHALQQYDFRTAAAGLTCPFLGIAGELDGTMAATMASQFNMVPGAEFSVIPNVGHVPNYQDPDTFNSVLLSFLDRIDLGPLKESR